jgi:SET domain-containing protein
MDRHHTFLFDLEDGTCIDGASGGNQSIYINHSCEPNCEPRVEDGHIYIYALRDIREGEELCYDYAYEREADEKDALYPCRCGSPRCRGTILAPKEEA